MGSVSWFSTQSGIPPTWPQLSYTWGLLDRAEMKDFLLSLTMAVLICLPGNDTRPQLVKVSCPPGGCPWEVNEQGASLGYPESLVVLSVEPHNNNKASRLLRAVSILYRLGDAKLGSRVSMGFVSQ